MVMTVRAELNAELDAIRSAGLNKNERVLLSPQAAHIRVGGSPEVLNLCANNYLGLANHPALVEVAKAALDRGGYGLSSVRFICGTQEIPNELEASISTFLGTEDTILYNSFVYSHGGRSEHLLH